jgi:hypothetical protein
MVFHWLRSFSQRFFALCAILFAAMFGGVSKKHYFCNVFIKTEDNADKRIQ